MPCRGGYHPPTQRRPGLRRHRFLSERKRWERKGGGGISISLPHTPTLKRPIRGASAPPLDVPPRLSYRQLPGRGGLRCNAPSARSGRTHRCAPAGKRCPAALHGRGNGSARGPTPTEMLIGVRRGRLRRLLHLNLLHLVDTSSRSLASPQAAKLIPSAALLPSRHGVSRAKWPAKHAAPFFRLAFSATGGASPENSSPNRTRFAGLRFGFPGTDLGGFFYTSICSIR